MEYVVQAFKVLKNLVHWQTQELRKLDFFRSPNPNTISLANKFLTMPPRPRIKIGNVEGRLIIAEQYRQHGALWDIIVNGFKRNPDLSSYPHIGYQFCA